MSLAEMSVPYWQGKGARIDDFIRRLLSQYSGTYQYNGRFSLPHVIVKYMEKKLDVTKPRYSEPILPFPPHSVILRGSTVLRKQTAFKVVYPCPFSLLADSIFPRSRKDRNDSASRVRSFSPGTFHETSPHGEKRGGTTVFSGYDEQNEGNNICPIQRRGRLNGLTFSQKEMHRLCF